MTGKIEGKVAIVTGAGVGIGEATARLFAKEGAKVICNSQSDSANLVSDSIKLEGGYAIFVKGDVTEEKTAHIIVDQAIRTYGQLDILVNNAGIVIPGRIDTHSVEDWDRTMAVNVRSVYLLSRFAFTYLKQSKGVIINVASSVALKGVKERAAYTASKGAVVSLTKAMAADYCEDHVRVNCICPGTTDTPSLERRIAKFSDPQQARSDFIARQPLKRFGVPQEIAEGILFLATDQFCTGTILSVDGGMTI